jgi:hypothetical protein
MLPVGWCIVRYLCPTQQEKMVWLVNGMVDELRDYFKSTHAAARYLHYIKQT